MNTEAVAKQRTEYCDVFKKFYLIISYNHLKYVTFNKKDIAVFDQMSLRRNNLHTWLPTHLK